jgi:hypothetical protein
VDIPENFLEDVKVMKNVLSFLLVSLSVMRFSHNSLGGEFERSRFLNEAPPSWVKYRSLLNELGRSGFKVRVRMQTVDLRTGEAVTDNSNLLQSMVQSKNECRLNIIPDPRIATEDQRAIGRNSRYAFTLLRPAGKDRWEISSVDLEQRAPSGAGQDRDKMMVSASALSELDKIPLDELVKDSGFELQDVRAVRVDGAELFEVHYEFNKVAANVFSRRGWVRLDPARFWLIHSAEYASIRSTNDEEATGKILKVEYGELHPGIPVEKRRIREVHSRPDEPNAIKVGIQPADVQLIFEYDSEVEPTLTERDFTLSAFGLPEPVLPGIRWWWVLALVVGALLLAVPAWRSRKSQK